ncbi:MAG: hypothetical protein WCA38_10885 [Candidatus Acidiferrales bacterium]
MAALTNMSWNSGHRMANTIPSTVNAPDLRHESGMRQAIVAVRDTMIVLAIQLVFRAALIMRRWNY